jgi:hypothetical protein
MSLHRFICIRIYSKHEITTPLDMFMAIVRIMCVDAIKLCFLK